MPWKQWAFLEKVSSADFQAYLQDQVVSVFTSSAQRASQLPAPREGFLSYLSDVDSLDLFNGTAWTPLMAGRRIAYADVTAADVAQGQTNIVIATASFTLTSQRLVKVEGVAAYSMVTGNSNGNIYARVGFDGNWSTSYLATSHSAGVGSIWGSQASAFSTLSAGVHTGRIGATNAASTGCAARYTAGNGYVAVYDYGPI